MKYITNPDVVKTKICDTYLLIPLRACYKTCRSVNKLNPLWAMTWDSLASGHTFEDQITAHKILTKLPEETIRAKVQSFVDSLVEKGFIFVEED